MDLTSDHPDDVYTVYGRVKTGLDAAGVVQFAGLHLDRTTLERANALVDDAIYINKEPCVEAVIVLLQRGEDKYGMRRVVRRVSNGKAWFE